MAVKPKSLITTSNNKLSKAETLDDFSDKVLDWFDIHGRTHLPWQQDINAYRVWISEIMLQQTQVATVIPYFERFMQSFPDVKTLAQASSDSVLHHWSGLGYYSRARNLHKSAQMIMQDFNGEFPTNQEDVMLLPGIGQSTSGAICSIAYKQPTAILDGNVKRVLARVFAVEGWPGKSDVLKRLWSIAEAHTPTQRVNDYTQAMMDLGATLCTRSKPACTQCPVQEHCQAHKQDNVQSYPGKKPRKILPVKETCMLVIRHGDKVLLQQRPTTGIWPGLWSFSEQTIIENTENPTTDKNLKRHLIHLGLNEPDSQHFQAGFRHTFSHYHLDIQVLVLDYKTAPIKAAMESGLLWFNPEQPAEVGLAAPVTKILKRLNSKSSRQQLELTV
ncbi:MAG: A/G-specific adenine glycosylase [Pseudomonadales bacterium]|nr:A/G-specific adenine glycosylase [Pseudomonadales bacterium]